MQKFFKYSLYHLAVIFLLVACKNVQVTRAEYIYYKTTSTQTKDFRLAKLMQPYENSMTKNMREVVG